VLVGSFDEFAALEACAGADECDEFGCVDRAPAGLRRFDQLERHGQARRAGAGALGDLGPVPQLAKALSTGFTRSELNQLMAAAPLIERRAQGI
jgi:hypothetical protein